MVAELASLTAFLAMGMTYATQECGLSAIANAPLAASKGSVAVRFCYAGWDVISIPIVSPTLRHSPISFDCLLTFLDTQLSIALLWNTAELATARVNGKGIHPGAHIAVDFSIFAGLLCATVLTLILFDATPAHVAAIPFEMFAWYIGPRSSPSGHLPYH